MNSKGLAPLVLIVLLGVGAVVGVGASAKPDGKGRVWYAPRTWFSHKPADKVDKAQVAEVKAEVREDAAKDKAVHAAAIEVDKTVKAAEQLPPSPAADVVKRTAGNAAALLGQVSPLTANEANANTALILGLLSEEISKRTAAEAKQVSAEKALALTSTELSKAQAAHADATSKLQKAEDGLRVAYDRENLLANESRALTSRLWIAGGTAVLLLIGLLYCRYCLGSVGVVLHGASKYIPAEQYKTLVAGLDGELAKVGQWMVGSGRRQAAAKEIAP